MSCSFFLFISLSRDLLIILFFFSFHIICFLILQLKIIDILSKDIEIMKSLGYNF